MENQYYRTFIAVPVQVGKDFLEARKELIKSLESERISWVKPENYHVTIRFLGDTELSKVKWISSTLREHVDCPAKEYIPLEQVGSFGPHKKPRVVWVGFGRNEIFEYLKQRVDRALEVCGIPSIDQPFRAHLTLGRIRIMKDLDRFYDTLEEMKEDFKGNIIPDKLVFYRSELGSSGPTYTSLYSLDFKD